MGVRIGHLDCRGRAVAGVVRQTARLSGRYPWPLLPASGAW